MRTIKIINGVYGHRPIGSKYIEPKRAGDPPFQVDDAEAERLVNLKVAEYADIVTKLVPVGVATGEIPTEKEKTGINIPDEQNDSEDEMELPEKPDYSTDMKATELREFMEECGLTYKVGMSKADMVAALDEYYGVDTEEEDTEDETEDTEKPPELGVEDPVV